MLDARQIFRKVTCGLWLLPWADEEPVFYCLALPWARRSLCTGREYLKTHRMRRSKLWRVFWNAGQSVGVLQHSDIGDLKTALAAEEAVGFAARWQAGRTKGSDCRWRMVDIPSHWRIPPKPNQRSTKSLLSAMSQEACVAAGEKAAAGKTSQRFWTASELVCPNINDRHWAPGAKACCWSSGLAALALPEGKLRCWRLKNWLKNDWPSIIIDSWRYVGVAPEVEDEDFDFDEAIILYKELLHWMMKRRFWLKQFQEFWWVGYMSWPTYKLDDSCWTRRSRHLSEMILVCWWRNTVRSNRWHFCSDLDRGLFPDLQWKRLGSK